jgi:hypothetical protein
MNSLRIARAAMRARPAASKISLQRRGYADTVSDKIKLTLAMPHQVRPSSKNSCSEPLKSLEHPETFIR